jgi:hypothetical protein
LHPRIGIEDEGAVADPGDGEELDVSARPVVVALTAHHQPVVVLDRRIMVVAAALVLAVCGVLLSLSLGNGAGAQPGTSFEAPATTVPAP